MVKKEKEFKINEFFLDFAKKCKESKRWQGDGWGICWLDQRKNWKVLKSLLPIWEDLKVLKIIPKSRIFLIHARQSSFEKDKGCLNYNQPFIYNQIAFVFNGEIIGMKPPILIEGEIGAQKVFNLIKKWAKKEKLEKAMKMTKDFIQKFSKKIKALNIGICDQKNFYVLSQYEKDRDYYGIKYYKDEKIKIVASQKILNFNFRILEKGEILIL